MGLDSVELVMKVEEAFAFSMPNEDAAVLVTVGQLYDYILANRFEGRQPGCLTSVTFYKVRRALMSVLGIARNDIRSLSDLNAIIPTRRRQVWSDLQKVTGLRFPELLRPVWVKIMATAVGLALIIAIFVFRWARTGMAGGLWPDLFLMPAIIFILYQETKPLAVAIRREFATVGGLTKRILQENFGAISDDCQRANAEEAWSTLRTIIVEQLGVRPDDVTREARFVEDLGMD
jgi:acyl carrier protein